MLRHRHISLIAPAAAAVALAAPSGAQAFTAQCTPNFDGPGSGWKLGRDGAFRSPATFSPGSAFDIGHMGLKVNGSGYPAIPDEPEQCNRTDTSATYPTRQVGGVLVSRSITVTNGVVRHLDTITNDTGQGKALDVDYALEVLGSQIPVTSEDGNDEADSKDAWVVLASGKASPFVRWGRRPRRGSTGATIPTATAWARPATRAPA